MLQEKHFDLIHFGTVTCNTISGKIKLEDSQCWQSETRQKKYEASGLEFKKSQLWITLPNLHTPGALYSVPTGQESRKGHRDDLLSPKAISISPLGKISSMENVVQTMERSRWLQSFTLAQPESWSSLTHFIILLFFFVRHSHKIYTVDPTR